MCGQPLVCARRLTDALPLGNPAFFGAQHRNHAVKVRGCAFCYSVLTALHLYQRHQIESRSCQLVHFLVLNTSAQCLQGGVTYLENRFAVGTSFQVEVSWRLDKVTSQTSAKLLFSCRHRWRRVSILTLRL